MSLQFAAAIQTPSVEKSGSRNWKTRNHFVTHRTVEVSTKNVSSVTDSISLSESFEEKLFNCVVQLKVDFRSFAMHLSKDERHRTFGELDFILALDDWDREDKLPVPASFSNFLKWTIFAHNRSWDSLGFSNEGHTLAAWVKGTMTLTAAFDVGKTVRWSWRDISPEGDINFASGSSTLNEFARQSDFLLGDES